MLGLIVLISATILALSGVTFFLTEYLRVISLRQNQTRAIYVAQAGIMQAIYDFRTTSGLRLGESPVPADTGRSGYADDDVFILGGQAADFLLVAMIPATWASDTLCSAADRQTLQSWTMRNVLQTDSTNPTPPDNLPDGLPVIIQRLQISWSPDNSERVYRVDLMAPGNTVYSSCTGTTSGGTITIANQAVAPLTQGTNQLWFSRRVSDDATLHMEVKDWIEVRFIMTDGSSRRVRFLPKNPRGSSANFTIKSTGEIRKGVFPFSLWRRIQAEYRLNDTDTDVSNLQEVGKLATDTSLLIAPAVPEAEQRPGDVEIYQKQP